MPQPSQSRGLVPALCLKQTDGNALTGKNVFAAGNYQIGGGIANQSATYFDGVPANAGVGNLTVLVPIRMWFRVPRADQQQQRRIRGIRVA